MGNSNSHNCSLTVLAGRLTVLTVKYIEKCIASMSLCRQLPQYPSANHHQSFRFSCLSVDTEMDKLMHGSLSWQDVQTVAQVQRWVGSPKACHGMLTAGLHSYKWTAVVGHRDACRKFLDVPGTCFGFNTRDRVGLHGMCSFQATCRICYAGSTSSRFVTGGDRRPTALFCSIDKSRRIGTLAIHLFMTLLCALHCHRI